MKHKLFVRCLTVTLLLALSQPTFAMLPNKQPYDPWKFAFQFLAASLFFMRPSPQEHPQPGDFTVLRIPDADAGQVSFFPGLPREVEEGIILSFNPYDLFLGVRLVCRRWHEAAFRILGRESYRDAYPRVLWVREGNPLTWVPVRYSVAGEFQQRVRAIADRHQETPEHLTDELTRIQTDFLATGVLNFLPLPQTPAETLAAICLESQLWWELMHWTLTNHFAVPLSKACRVTGLEKYNGVWTSIFNQINAAEFLGIGSALPSETNNFLSIGISRLTRDMRDAVFSMCSFWAQEELVTRLNRGAHEGGNLESILPPILRYAAFVLQMEAITLRSTPEFLKLREEYTKYLDEKLTAGQIRHILFMFDLPQSNPFTQIEVEVLRTFLKGHR